jgi:hypothetical protein
MEGFLLLIGAISALFVLLPYLLLMWRLTNRQRVAAFAAISVVLLVLSGQVFDLSHPSQNQFLQGIWSLVFFALMLGWFVCGFVHAAVVALDKKQFGEAISERVTTPLPTIVKDPSQFANRTVRTEGMVSAVCQSMGCWMQIRDESGKAHIKMAGHSFFVPKTSSGHRAVVQGKVVGSDPPNSCAGGDGCGNQEVTQVQIEATGIEFID